MRSDRKGGEGRAWRGSTARLLLAGLASLVGVLLWTALAGGTQPYETYEAKVAEDSPAAQFRFNDASGSSKVADSVGSYTATNNGIKLAEEGPFAGSKSGSFASSAYAALPSSPLSSATAFTAEGWVYWNGGASYKQPIFDLGSSSTNYMYLTPASSLSGHPMLFEIRTSSKTFQVTATTLTSKKWEYVAVSETSGGVLNLYLNGEKVGETKSVTLSPSSLGSVSKDWLGKSVVSGEPFYEGRLSNMAFYTKALSTERILAHYNAAEFPVNTVLPAISGTARDGSTLTAKPETWSGLTPITYTYQWTRCNTAGSECANIESATSTTYKAGHEDVGKTLRVAVKGTNSAGNSSATSAQTATVEALKPSNTSLPAISGTAESGQLLTVSNGSWEGTPTISYSYQWEKCNSSGESCSNISGATASSYRVLNSQIGGTLRAVVTASNAAGSTNATSAATATITAGPPINMELPTLSGTAEEGETLSASTGAWVGGEPFSYTYQWRSCNSSGESCSNISGATSAAYKLTSSSVGKTLRIVVTAKNSVGSVEATSAASAVVVAAPPSNSALPTISGTDEQGKTLTASTGSWTGAEPFSFIYQWRRCNSSGESCSSISGATSPTYVLGLSDVGGTLRVVVTVSNPGGSAPATSSHTSVIAASTPPSNISLPTISGNADDGQTLIASTGSWSGSSPISFAYQWQSCNPQGKECRDIEDATGPNYALASGDLETELRVIVTASNVAGSAQATSAASAEVEPGAPSELEAPSISGNPNADETLYANGGIWGGTETEVGYQWERCNATGGECADIAGATEAAYQLGESEVGSTLRIRVGVSNALGSVTDISLATDVISKASSLTDTSEPSISGTPQSGSTLIAGDGSWLGLSAISYSTLWQRCDPYGDNCEAWEDASAYYPTAGDIGSTFRVQVTASEIGGTATRTSAASQPIAAESDPVSEGPPAVSGTGLKGHVLTATAGTWSGEGPITYSYHWERCGEGGEGCSAISGATASTYTLTEGDVASTLRALVTATDEGGSTTAASSATAVISPTTLVNTVAPSITGAHEIGRALSADRGIWTAEGALTYAYKWDRCNEKGESCSPISGATESAYTPASTDVGKALRVVVTAEGAAGTESVASAVTPVIGSESLAPENLFVPTIEGNLTSGETLTAQTGTWESSETISYKYQWQKCDEEGEECANISEATSSTYKLIEGDIDSTLRVVVTGENSLGTASATSEQSEVVGATGPPTNTDMPTIHGTAKQGERLTVGNGSWSGSRPLSYYYRWERCNGAGESCTAIESATKPSYTIASGDVGSTLRVEVTAKNALGSAGAVSTQTTVVLGSEAGTTPAIELAETTDPSVLQPATTATLEEQEVKPAISDSGESLSGTTALTTSSVSKETPGEFAINTPSGELSFQPVNSAPNATKTPTIVNGAAAVFAGTSNATDTIVRPDALGATTLLQLRSAEAPTSFSWEVGLGPNQRLEELSGGAVAVVEVPSSSPLEGSLGEGLESPEPSEAEAEHEGSGESGEAAEGALEEGISGEGTLEKLAAAPTASTPVVEPQAGELHPQETKAQYESATSAVASAEEHTYGTTLMVIEPPKVMDAEGSTVSSSLSIENDTVTMTLSPSGGTKFPVTTETNIAAPSDGASIAKASKTRYGLSDPKATSFEDSEEVSGKPEGHFDKHLKEGPLHVGIARDVVPYNWHPNNPGLIGWLKAVKKAGLQPYITFTVEPDQFCHPHRPCAQTSIGSYEAHVKELVSGLMKRHAEEPSVIPLVTLWGAWNEPDFHNEVEENPLYKNAKRAALFWKKARAILRQMGCNCTMVAGEFAEDDGYIGEYAGTIQHSRAFWSGYPHVWGVHDYHDLVSYYDHPHNSYAEAFLKKLGRRLHNPRIWFSEQGVARRNGSKPTHLVGNSEAENIKRQVDAATDFLRLGNVHLAKEQGRVEVVDYYLYKGPSAAKIVEKPNAFDSALLPGEGVTEEEKHPADDPRPAYCVLALGLEGCPASSKTQSVVTNSVTPKGGTLSAIVNPNGLATKYLFKYGTTEAYGETTTATALANADGKQNVTAALGGLEPCMTYHYQAAAENIANEGVPGLGGDRTMKTSCPATDVAAGNGFTCAVIYDGSVDCWGEGSSGQLGDGKTENSSKPVKVSGITDAVEVTAGGADACARLSGGGIECWGGNGEGQLGNGSTANSATPVHVSGIGNAIVVSTGWDATCAALSSGGVDCWGANGFGELGNGTTTRSTTPVAVTGITTAEAVSAGGEYACALLSSGSVDCWGESEGGELGDGKLTDSSTPVKVTGLTSATSITAAYNHGESHVCALRSGGDISCWGVGGAGELGNGTTGSEKCGPELASLTICDLTPVSASAITTGSDVSGGSDDTCAVLSSGKVDCWGYNANGELGDGTTSGPETCGEPENLFSCSSVPVPVSGITQATAVSTDGGHACALLTSGILECWGNNEGGELGDGTTEGRSAPVAVKGIE